MFDINDVRDIDISSKEGKLLVAAIAVLTTLREDDLRDNKWGRSINYNSALTKLADLTSKMFQKKHRTEGIAKVKMKRHLNK